MTGEPTSTVLTLRPQGSRAVQQASASKARERRWAPKVKTGCQTCRSRRVKCDEAKPECQRCITGGFTCKGYPLIQKAPVTTFWAGVSTTSAPAEVTPTPGALQLSHFFRTQVVSTCYDEFSRDMWLRQYPQAAQSVPAIWHGCNAIASCWQLMAIDTTNSILKGAAEKVRQDGMRQYSHMLTELVKVAHRPTLSAADKSTILAVNLLATIYLNGTGQIADQNVIIANTANLFRRWQPWLNESAYPIPSTFILLMFLKYERYKENSTLITCQKPWLWNEALLSLQSRPLLTCTDASAELEMLSMGLQSTFPTFLNIWTDANAVAMSHATLATFRQIFVSWSERLDAFKVSGRLRNEDRGPLSVLEIRRIVVGVMLQVDITRLEICWDDFEGEFNKALLLAERLLSDTTMPAFTPTLSQLLHWMAKACRNPKLRRRMVSLTEAQYKKFPGPRHPSAKIRRSPFAVINAIISTEEVAWSYINDGYSPGECGCSEQGCIDGEYVCNSHRVTQVHLKGGNPLGGELKLQTVGDIMRNQAGQVMYVRSMVWG